MTFTVFVVCFVFTLTCMPATFWTLIDAKTESQVPLTVVLMVYWTQYAINFMIYALTSKQFRKAYLLLIKDTFSRFKGSEEGSLEAVVYIETKLLPTKIRNFYKNLDENVTSFGDFEAGSTHSKPDEWGLNEPFMMSTKVATQVSFFTRKSSKVVVVRQTFAGAKRRYSHGSRDDFLRITKMMEQKSMRGKENRMDVFADTVMADEGLLSRNFDDGDRTETSVTAHMKLETKYDVGRKMEVLSLVSCRSNASFNVATPLNWKGLNEDF